MPIVPRLSDIPADETAAPAARPSIVTSAVESQKQQGGLRASLIRNFSEDPDQFAKALELSNRTGFSVDLVKRNQPEIENYVEAHKVDPIKFRLENPALFDFMEQKDENLVVSKDDVGNLSGVERAFKSVPMVSKDDPGNLGKFARMMKTIPRAFQSGQDQVELSGIRFKQMEGKATPEEITRGDQISAESQRQHRYAADGFFEEAAIETAKMAPTTLQAIKGGVKGAGVGAVVGAATGAAAGAATGAGVLGVPTGGVGLIPGAGLGAAAGATAGAAAGAGAGFTTGAAYESFKMEAGLAFDEFRGFKDGAGQPLDMGTMTAAASAVGMVNAGLEITGLGALLKTIPGGEKLVGGKAANAVKAALKSPTVLAAFKSAGAKFAHSVTVETSTEVAQELVTIVAGELIKQQAGGEAATGQAIGQRLLDTLVATAKGTFMLAGTGAGASFVADSRRAANAQSSVDRMTALGESAKASKLLQRMPSKFREFVEAVKDKHGTVENVYVDANKATELFQSAGLDASEVFGEMMGERGREAYAEAYALDGRIAVPIEVYAEKLAGTDWHKGLVEHSTLDEDGMTSFEAAQFDKDRERMLQEVYDGQGRQADDPANPIFNDTVAGLLGAGFSQKDAEDQAQLRVGLFRGVAQRAGLTADQFLERFPLDVTRPLPSVLTDRRKVGALDPLLDAVRSGKLPTDDELFGPRLISEIVKRGGIDPESVGGPDLLAILDKEKRPGLISGKGMTVEHMGESLAEGGWREAFTNLDDYGRPDYRDLLEMVRDDLHGELRSPNARNEERLGFRQAAEDLGNEVHRLGMDIHSLTNEQISQRLAEEDAKAAQGRVLEQAATVTARAVQAIRDVIARMRGATPSSVSADLMPVAPESVAEAAEHGLDIGGYVHMIDGSAIRHVQKKHGDAVEEGKRGQVAVTDQDFERIPDVLSSPDMTAYGLKNDIGRPMIAYVKRLADGTFLYLEEVRSKRQRLALQSIRKYPATTNALSILESVRHNARNDGGDAVTVVESPAPRQLGAGEELNQSAYHGTPHAVEKFSLQKIGTGEGAQAYGYGLYFAGHRAVAEHYRKTLSDATSATGAVLVGGRKVEAFSPEGHAARLLFYNDAREIKAAAKQWLKEAKAGEAWAVEQARNQGLTAVEYYERLNAFLANQKRRDVQVIKGNLYKVELPEDAELLDYDAPIAKQNAIVQEIARTFLREEGHLRDGENGPRQLTAAFNSAAMELGGMARDGDGSTLYEMLAKKLGSEQAASLHFAEHGVPGMRFKAGQIANVKGGGHNYVMWDEAAISEPQSLYQKRGTEPRGSIKGAMPGDRRPDGTRPFNISLLRKANLTTFTHELGHMAFAILADLAADFSVIPEAERTGNQSQLVADYQSLLAWSGAQSFEAMTVPQLEKLARGMEAYVLEGKAPSLELRAAFARLRSFMAAVYRTLKGLIKDAGQNIDLNDEVRAVFDRLLASDEAIQQAREADKFDAIWKAPDEMLSLGATGEEVAAYMRANQSAQDRATDKLTAKVMAPLRRRREESFAELRETVETEVAGELDATPVYRAIAALSGVNVPPEMAGIIRKLDKGWLLDKYGQEWINKNLLRRGVYAAEGGMSADLAASLLGFDSGRSLVEAIAEAPLRREYLKAETERRLNEIIPDPMRDGSLSDEAVAAVHNERRGDVLALELKILNRASGGGKETSKQVARRIAERIVGDRAVRDIRPNRYLLDEKRAARKATEALLAKDYEAAATAKRQELLSFYLWRVSQDAREEADKARDYLDSYTKNAARERLAKAGAEYVEQVDDMLAAYGFRAPGVAPSGLREWTRLQDEAGHETAIPDEVIRRSEGKAVNWRDVSMDELRGLRDAVRNVSHLAKLSREALANDQTVEWEAAREDLAGRIRSTLDEKKKPFTDAEATTWESVRAFTGKLMDSVLRPETVVEWLDGGTTGPWHDLFWNQAQAAHDRRDTLRERVMKPLVDMVEKWDAKQRARMAEKIPIASLGEALTRSTLVSMALNMGNASNLDKLMRGGIWRDGKHVEFTDQTAREVREALSADDWKMVQFIWDQVDAMWPDVVEFQKSMGGLVPDKVEAVAVDTPAGVLRGGYWPVVYDPRQSAIGAKQEAAKSIKEALGALTKASTKKGFLKSRTSVARPLLLDFQRILVRHVDEVITDLTHRRFIMQANRVLEDAEIASLIRTRLGDVPFESLKGMVGHTISSRNYYDPALDAQDRLFDRIVSNTAVAALGFKVATSIGNLVVAPIQAAARVSPARMTSALAQFMSAPKQTRDLVWSLSPQMRYRAENLDASFSEVLKSLRGEHSIRAQVARASMSVHRWADFLGSTVIWLAKYQQEVAEQSVPDTAAAVRAADKAIRQTQTAGAPKDLSAFERSPTSKLVKLFLGPMLIMNNRIRDAVQLRGAVKNVPEAIGTLFAVWFIPAFLFELAVGRGPDDDDDDGLDVGDVAKWAGIKTAMYPFMTLPYLRDIAAGVEAALSHKPAFARSNPLVEAGNMLVNAGAKVTGALFGEDEVDEEKLAKSLIRAAGPIIGLPTGALTLPGDLIYDVLTGEYDPEGVSDLKYLIYRRPAEKNP